MNPLTAKVNESVSVEFMISVCIAIIAKHVIIAPYLISSFLPSFMINVDQAYPLHSM